MPRASRHFLPGYLWHVTHRCHEKSFLLNYKTDRKRWLYWLFQAKKRYGLCVLNYMVTSNHVHLLVKDTGVGVIPRSMQLVAGRVAREFNSRKGRRGAFWQDRYHATAVEDNHHFVHAMIYIDLNMVRAGVISHPFQWPFCGYYELMTRRKRYSIINRGELMRVLDVRNEPDLMRRRRNWIDDAVANGPLCRNEKWTNGLAVGGQVFLETMKQKLGSKGRGRRVQFRDWEEGGVIKEERSVYSPYSSIESWG
jgi:putative transposase